MKENEEARRLTTIPGVGPTIASALIAAVGKGETFEHGRDLAAWLGLVPRQFTTGGRPKLLGISKRGNKYLRRQLIHGARAPLPYVVERDTPLGRWAKDLSSRAHRNVAIVAFANKLARIAWAVLRRKERLPRQDCRRRRRVRRSDTKRRTAKGVCERVTTGWPDSQTALRKPGSKNGAI